MLQCAVKFCGGCNPRYDRGAAYKRAVRELKDVAAFSTAQDRVKYDVLLIIRGCTQCPYIYEEIQAENRVVCTSEESIDKAVEEIRRLAEVKTEN